jgi:hypothetical protein
LKSSGADVREELLGLASEETRVREELAGDGSLYEGYHPRMEEVHRRKAERLREIMKQVGWPGVSLVGEDGERAAWLILQHAIGEPAFQRRGLEVLSKAAGRGEAPVVQVAMLEDRIRTCEGRGQRYGTQFDWDEHGEMSPVPIEEPEGVNERRREVELPPLEGQIRRMREQVAANGGRAPMDWAMRREEMEAWCRAVGWRR